MVKNQRGFSEVILVIVAVIVLIFIGLVILGSTGSKPSNKTNKTSSPTSSNSSDNSYAISWPAGWQKVPNVPDDIIAAYQSPAVDSQNGHSFKSNITLKT